MVQIINNNQPQLSLQQATWNKPQSATTNHRPGKPDTLSQHATTKPDKLSQCAKCRKAIPPCTTKDTVYKGLLEPRAVDKQWTRGRQKQETNCEDHTSRASTTTLQEARQGIRHEA